MSLAKDIIRKEYKNSRNFMTPTVLRCGLRGDFAYEVSTGTGLCREPIWGVSVVEYELDGEKLITTNRRIDLSNCYCSKYEVKAAIEKLATEEATI